MFREVNTFSYSENLFSFYIEGIGRLL